MTICVNCRGVIGKKDKKVKCPKCGKYVCAVCTYAHLKYVCKDGNPIIEKTPVNRVIDDIILAYNKYKNLTQCSDPLNEIINILKEITHNG